MYVNPRLADHLEAQTSSGTGTMGEDRLTERQRRRLTREIASYEPYRRLNTILEVGAGRGRLLAEAAAVGWRTCAVELNESAIAYLRQAGLDRILVEPAEEMTPPPESADVVRIWDVIEHLTSPVRAIANIRRALRPGGLLRLATTNFASLSRMVNGPEWVYLNGADHIYLFEPATIRQLLTQAGFGRIRIRTRSFNLRRKLYHPERGLAPAQPALKPFRKLIDAVVGFTPYGHQMIVTAQKTLTGSPSKTPTCLRPDEPIPRD